MRALTVLDILERTAAKLPEKVYLKDERESVTYGQCVDRARRFGYALHREMAGARRPVVLFMDKSCRCVVSMLGVLYSGNFYVPMDVKTPIERLESILRTLVDPVVVTTEQEKRLLEEIGYTGELLLYEELLDRCQDRADEDTLARVRRGTLDTDLMYVIFTSGSTGIPKGVAVMHRSVVDYIDAFLSEVCLSPEDVVGNQTPFYADMSLKDIYMTMASGAAVCIIPQKYFMTPKKLLQYLDDNGVTVIMWVPTAYRIVSQFDGLSRTLPQSLRTLIFTGEGMPLPVFRYWREHYPDRRFVQLYGPSEITGACTYYSVREGDGTDGPIPIGKPFANTGILLLTEDGRVVLPGEPDVPGEICVYGTCLAAGYYNDPEKTAGAFVQNPLVTAVPSKMYKTGDLGYWDGDGELVFISRKDYQVKHGGRRVELGEVEAAFQAVEGVKAACCVQDRRADKLVLYYVGDVSEEKISLAVRDKLPKYMIPAVYNRMEQLPTLPNGKLDRKRLDLLANG